MNPSDKYEQIKDIKHLNPVELEAMVLHHEQQIKDLARAIEQAHGIGVEDEHNIPNI